MENEYERSLQVTAQKFAEATNQLKHCRDKLTEATNTFNNANSTLEKLRDELGKCVGKNVRTRVFKLLSNGEVVVVSYNDPYTSVEVCEIA